MSAVSSSQLSVNMSLTDAILGSGPVVQLTLLTLIFLSVLCWAVAYFKRQQFKKIKIANEPFTNRFWKATSLDRLYEDVDQFKDSNLARIFKAGYSELQKLAQSRHGAEGENTSVIGLSGVDNLERTLRKAIENETALLESRLTWLATTGSTGPFIGLFGTVWGILTAFHKIGATGSASLAVVAPGISEALVATAIGLAAAIPAVILYNHFVTQVKSLEMEMNNFATDFLNISKRNFFKGN